MARKSTGDSLLELGRLYGDRGDFLLSIEKLEEATQIFFAEKDFDNYLECQNRLLRLYAETDNQEKTTATKETLQDLVLKEGVELNAKTYYTLGLCASYKGQTDVALGYLQKSLSLALASDNKKDVCYAINGIAHVYFQLGRYNDTLKEIYNLQVFFQVLDLPDLKISTNLMNGHVLRKLKKYDQALDIFWQCYESLKITKNLYLYIYVLRSLGRTYLDLGEKDLARMYLTLTKKTLDPTNMVFLAREIDKLIAELGVDRYAGFDLVLDKSANTIVEHKLGKVDFKNQFILMDLLKLFLQNPGRVFSKEELVKEVWTQNYNPAIHDNKIYVTIKRLRQLIEPDIDKPKYIFRAKNGYFLNNEAKVLIEN